MEAKSAFGAVLGCAVLLSGCGGGAGDLDTIIKRGTVIVLTRNAPTTYYEEKDGQYAGPEYDLVEAFAKDLGVRTEYRVAANIDDLIEQLRAGKADFAAASLSKTPARELE